MIFHSRSRKQKLRFEVSHVLSPACVQTHSSFQLHLRRSPSATPNYHSIPEQRSAAKFKQTQSAKCIVALTHYRCTVPIKRLPYYNVNRWRSPRVSLLFALAAFLRLLRIASCASLCWRFLVGDYFDGEVSVAWKSADRPRNEAAASN